MKKKFTGRKSAVVPQGKPPKKLSRTAVILIAVFACIAVVTAIVVPIVLIRVEDSTAVKPTFRAFDADKDYSVTVEWNQVKNAERYLYQYVYGDPTENYSNAVVGSTENTLLTLERKKGKLNFRVKSVRGDTEYDYSEWISIDIPAWKLSTPVITIDSSNLMASWVPVRYRYYTVTDKTVSSYLFYISVNGERFSMTDLCSVTNSTDLYSTAMQYMRNETAYDDYITGDSDVWPADITLTIHVKAVTEQYYAGMALSVAGTDSVAQALYNIYEDSDYGECTLIITKDIYDALPTSSK